MTTTKTNISKSGATRKIGLLTGPVGGRSQGETRIVSDWSQVQALHDELVALGGGDLHFIPNATYVVPAGGGITVDIAYVGLQFNGALLNCSAWYGDTQANSTSGDVITVAGSKPLHDWPPNLGYIRQIANGVIYGVVDAATRGDWGPTAIKFHRPYAEDSGAGFTGDAANSNCVISHMNVTGVRRGAEYGSRAYFVHWDHSFVTRCRTGIYTMANPKDFAEKDTFFEVVIAECYTAIDSTQAGQIYTFTNCSLDYNRQIANLALGAKLFFNSSHWEFNYGLNAGESLTPIAITGANTSVHARNMTVAYVGAGQNPFWSSFVTMDNSSQVFDLEASKVVGMGRLGDTTSFDAWVIVTANAAPMVRIKTDANGILPQDVPSMSMVSEQSGVIGLLRNGCGWPYGQLNNLSGKAGTAAALADVAADENGVTRKNAKSMLKLQNGTPGTSAKYYINLPVRNFAARHAWTLFFNTQAITAGAPVIREMVATVAAKWDGTTVTWGAAPDSPTYTNAGGVSLAIAQNWTRHGWKDHTTQFYPSQRLNPSSFVTIEVDMTNATGPLYLSHFGFDVITNSN